MHTIKYKLAYCMDWIPTLSEWQGPLFLRIVDALAADIASGRLVRGQRLPTHRALAAALDLDLTTITRAYGEARALGGAGRSRDFRFRDDGAPRARSPRSGQYRSVDEPAAAAGRGQSRSA